MSTVQLRAPLQREQVRTLRAGDMVLLSGTIYTARDAAHKRVCEALAAGEEAPFPLQGSVLYYVGPTPAPPGSAIGAAGPTTSYRMDTYTPELLRRGVAATIGKGRRSSGVRQALQDYGGVYFGATGGAGALLAQRILSARVIAYPDLGPEAIRELEVADFPVVVANDCHGGELYARAQRSGRS